MVDKSNVSDYDPIKGESCVCSGCKTKVVDDLSKVRESSGGFFVRVWRNPVLATWCLVLVLIVGLCFLFYSFWSFDKDGVACQSNPFVWGAERVVGGEVGGLFCGCYVEDDSFNVKFGDWYGLDPLSRESYGSVVSD